MTTDNLIAAFSKSIKPDDTLRYRVRVERALPRESIRVRVAVTALAPARDANRESTESRIREVLAAFIEADWAFTGINRTADTAGYERVTLTASARVSPAEDYNLIERARAASREGFALTEPQADYSLPISTIDKVVAELRLEAAGQVTTELDAFRAATSRDWRVGDIEFGISRPQDWRATSKGAYRNESEDLVAPGEEAGLASAERITLVAQVLLRSTATQTEGALP